MGSVRAGLRPRPGYNERPLGGHHLLLGHLGPPGRVLDVGCASGYLAEQLTVRGHVVTGVERDPIAADVARRWCEQVLVGDVETMPLPFPEHSFDVVLCGDVLEHLKEPAVLLRRLRPALVPGGRLVVSTPNVANWSVRLALLGGRWQYRERGILDRTHLRFFTRATLVELLERTGFDVLEVDFTVPFPLVGSALVERAARAVGRLRPTLFAYQFVAVAVRR